MLVVTLYWAAAAAPPPRRPGRFPLPDPVPAGPDLDWLIVNFEILFWSGENFSVFSFWNFMCAWVRKVAARVACGDGKFGMRCLAWTLSGLFRSGGQL